MVQDSFKIEGFLQKSCTILSKSCIGLLKNKRFGEIELWRSNELSFSICLQNKPQCSPFPIRFADITWSGRFCWWCHCSLNLMIHQFWNSFIDHNGPLAILPINDLCVMTLPQVLSKYSCGFLIGSICAEIILIDIDLSKTFSGLSILLNCRGNFEQSSILRIFSCFFSKMQEMISTMRPIVSKTQLLPLYLPGSE
jgi:hypothetical protein